MWIPSVESLATTSAGNAFLVCRWREFFDRETPDSYQPRIFHLPLLVAEIASIAKAIQTETYLGAHFSHIQRECRSRILAEKAFFFLCTDDEVATLEFIATDGGDAAQIATVADALLASGFSDRYEETSLTHGRACLLVYLHRLTPAKRAAERWLGLWATIALRKRYHISEGYLEWVEKAISGNLEDNLATIAQDIAAHDREYRCVLSVVARKRPHEADVGGNVLSQSATQLKAVFDSAGINLAHHSLLPGYSPTKDELLVETKENALSRRDAIHRAIRRVRPLLNLYGFYLGAPPAKPIIQGWAASNNSSFKRIESGPAEMGDVRPRRNTAKLTKIAVRSALKKPLDPVIANALELHNMALSSPDLRVRFLTMWSALECLAPKIGNESVITRVMDMTVPILTWRRMEKQIRYLGRDLLSWRQATGTSEVPLQCLPNATSTEVPSEDVLLVVTRPAHHPDIVELLKAVSGHPLLCWRVNATWEVFTDPSALASDLRNSGERLTWHLGRIYRMRNRLAHAGDDSVLVEPLLSNLQFYLSTTISRLLHVITAQPGHDADSAVNHWAALSHSVIDALEKTPASIQVSQLMPNPRLLKDQLPWCRPA